MGYQIIDANGKVTVKLADDMYVKSVAALREELLALISAGKHCYIFDMHDLRYIDSAGLGLMVTVLKRVAPNGGEVRVRNLHGVIKELFEQTRLEKIFIVE